MSTMVKKYVPNLVDAEGDPEIVNFFRQIALDNPKDAPYFIKCAKAAALNSVEDPNCHIQASPLFELSSIKISKDLFQIMESDKGDSGPVPEIQVYGHILLIDDKGNAFTLFKLNCQDAKPVALLDDDSVILRKPQLGEPRCLPKNLKLRIYLKDKIRDVLFVDDLVFLDFSREGSYDRMKYRKLDYTVDPMRRKSRRLESSLEMGFTIFHCAVLASINVTCLSAGNDVSNFQLKASIQLRNSKVVHHELLDDKPSISEFGGALKELCVLAVPAYSSLKIIATFLSSCGDVEITKAFEFNPRNRRYELVDKIEKIEWKNCKMLVSVTWANARQKLPETYVREWECDDADSDSDSDSDSDNDSDTDTDTDNDADSAKERGSFEKPPPRKKPASTSKFERRMKFHYLNRNIKRLELQHMVEMKLKENQIGHYIQPHLQALCNRRWVVTRGQNELVELFCVSICSFDDYDGAASSITGIIDSYESNRKLDYFSGKDEKKTGILYPHVTHECLMGPNFSMKLDLKDAEGHQISLGYVDYDDRNVVPWYDRRVCSVVVGKHGYAAVYYTVFQDAQQARINIRLMPENGAAVCLRGTIHARYSNFRYSTKYDKDYFQSVLFEKGESELVNGGGEVPLTKSVVAVPFNGYLIVKTELLVLLDGKHVETLKGEIAFKPRDGDIEPREAEEIICGSKSSSTYHLLVNVVWGYPEFAQEFGCSSRSISS